MEDGLDCLWIKIKEDKILDGSLIIVLIIQKERIKEGFFTIPRDDHWG